MDATDTGYGFSMNGIQQVQLLLEIDISSS